MNSVQQSFNVENYLFDKANLDKIINEDYRIIDRLCKKIDVIGKVYKAYSNDFVRKADNEELSATAYKMFLELLQLEESLDFKFLNTALKLNEVLLFKKIIDEITSNNNKVKILRKINLLYERG